MNLKKVVESENWRIMNTPIANNNKIIGYYSDYGLYQEIIQIGGIDESKEEFSLLSMVKFMHNTHKKDVYSYIGSDGRYANITVSTKRIICSEGMNRLHKFDTEIGMTEFLYIDEREKLIKSIYSKSLHAAKKSLSNDISVRRHTCFDNELCVWEPKPYDNF